MAEELLPVGSVIRLDGAAFLAVILGFYVDDGEQMYDYLAVPYPAGFDDPANAMLVNAEGIAEVVSRGYLDADGKRVLQAAAELMSAQEEAYVTVGAALEDAGMFGEDAGSFNME